MAGSASEDSICAELELEWNSIGLSPINGLSKLRRKGSIIDTVSVGIYIGREYFQLLTIMSMSLATCS